MNENLKNFFEKMQNFFPSTRKAYCESQKQYGELLGTVVIEDIFMPEILDLLVKNENVDLLMDLFNYFEELLEENDPYLVNVFSTTVLEILGNDKAILDIAKEYMGPKTAHMQIEVDKDLGRL